jgi:hypothetical protein
VGAVWQARSKARCAFLMQTGDDFEAIKAAVKK